VETEYAWAMVLQYVVEDEERRASAQNFGTFIDWL
jgi:hypothetical protein